MFYSKRNLRFNLYEVLNATELTEFDYFEDHSEETFELILDAAEQIAEKMLLPLLTEMDRDEPQLIDGKIVIHEGMKPIIKKFGDDGWINATFSYDEGGQQLPNLIHNAAAFIFQAANYSASVFPFLTTGAANLIRTFGSENLKETFLENMFSGKWQGTMALTEPDAGSSLSDISTSATLTDIEGIYKIKGQKIYISCGDHNACENVIHLMLAKIVGGPLGAKGISLFVVPQKRITNEVVDLQPNDVVTAGVYHKMGYKGAPIAHLMMGSEDGCEGYLLGEPHKGLSYMFQMMNEARIGVGMNAAAIGTAAYYASLQYAKERPQGRKVSEKDPTKPQVSIIQHADVKRMLFFQKSVVEGSLSLLLFCSKLSDIMHVATGDKQAKAALLLDFLTPIAKSYPSEMCCLSTSAAVQILGGAGYTTDFPVEQFYREARIHPIHEGTTGIHGMDLLGRKITIANGQAAALFFIECGKTIQDAKTFENLNTKAEVLEKQLSTLQKTTNHLLQIAKAGETEKYLADATLFLEMTGIIAIAWRWLAMSVVAQKALQKEKTHAADQSFYHGKIATMQYFFDYELIKVDTLSKRLFSTDFVTLEAQESWF